MATIVKRKLKDHTTYAIQVVGLNDKRVTFGLGHLGKIDKADAKYHARHIDHLVRYHKSNAAIPLDHKTVAWADDQKGTKLHDQLAKAGLIERTEVVTLGQWVSDYIESIAPIVKPSTLPSYRNIQRNLVACFGASKPMASFIASDGDKLNRFLRAEARKKGKGRGKGLADNTSRRRIGLARTIFDAAIRSKLLDENPFKQKHIPATVRGSKEKFHFVPISDYQHLLEAAPDHDWRCIIALARIGGVRGISEIIGLTWDDVNWERNRVRITSPKTAHHPNGGHRYTPLFPELREVLQDAYDAAEPGTVYVVNRYRRADQNLRTTFNKIVKRAGLPVWQKPFVNMRSSRAIELRRLGFAEHCCTEWLGHDSKVATEHYLRVQDDDYVRAASCAAFSLTSESANRVISRTDAHTAPTENGVSDELCGIGSESGEERWARQDSNL